MPTSENSLSQNEAHLESVNAILKLLDILCVVFSRGNDGDSI